MTEWTKKKEVKTEIRDGQYFLTGPLVIPDQPNINGNVYTKEVIEKMKEDIKKMISEKKAEVFFVEEPTYLAPTLNMAVGTIEKIEDVDITIRLLDTPTAQTLKQVIKAKLPKRGFDFGINGFGTVDENNVINDFVLRDVTLIKSEDE